MFIRLYLKDLWLRKWKRFKKKAINIRDSPITPIISVKFINSMFLYDLQTFKY